MNRSDRSHWWLALSAALVGIGVTLAVALDSTLWVALGAVLVLAGVITFAIAAKEYRAATSETERPQTSFIQGDTSDSIFEDNTSDADVFQLGNTARSVYRRNTLRKGPGGKRRGRPRRGG